MSQWLTNQSGEPQASAFSYTARTDDSCYYGDGAQQMLHRHEEGTHHRDGNYGTQRRHAAAHPSAGSYYNSSKTADSSRRSTLPNTGALSSTGASTATTAATNAVGRGGNKMLYSNGPGGNSRDSIAVHSSRNSRSTTMATNGRRGGHTTSKESMYLQPQSSTRSAVQDQYNRKGGLPFDIIEGGLVTEPYSTGDLKAIVAELDGRVARREASSRNRYHSGSPYTTASRRKLGGSGQYSGRSSDWCVSSSQGSYEAGYVPRHHRRYREPTLATVDEIVLNEEDLHSTVPLKDRQQHHGHEHGEGGAVALHALKVAEANYRRNVGGGGDAQQAGEYMQQGGASRGDIDGAFVGQQLHNELHSALVLPNNLRFESYSRSNKVVVQADCATREYWFKVLCCVAD